MGNAHSVMSICQCELHQTRLSRSACNCQASQALNLMPLPVVPAHTRLLVLCTAVMHGQHLDTPPPHLPLPLPVPPHLLLVLHPAPLLLVVAAPLAAATFPAAAACCLQLLLLAALQWVAVMLAQTH